jgi:hypothetical protein
MKCLSYSLGERIKFLLRVKTEYCISEKIFLKYLLGLRFIDAKIFQKFFPQFAEIVITKHSYAICLESRTYTVKKKGKFMRDRA